MEQQAYREQFELEDAHWWFEGRRAVIWALLDRAGLTAPNDSEAASGATASRVGQRRSEPGVIIRIVYPFTG